MYKAILLTAIVAMTVAGFMLSSQPVKAVLPNPCPGGATTCIEPGLIHSPGGTITCTGHTRTVTSSDGRTTTQPNAC